MRETMQAGKYLCKITSHSLTQSKKKDWQVVIKFQPILFEPRDTKEPVAIEFPQTCTYWGWLTDKGKQWVVEDLETLGFDGKISELHNGDALVGVEAPFLLSHQKQDDGSTFERWRVFSQRDPKPPVEINDGDLMKLDALVGSIGKGSKETVAKVADEELDF